MGSENDIGRDQLFALAYRELRAIAHRRLAGARRGEGTFSTTALVHEAYLKLADRTGPGWHNRAHLLACASLAMRHVLVDRARARRSRKRGGATGGAAQRVTLDDEVLTVEDQSETLLALNDALDRLAAAAPRLAQVVECRFFGGLSEQETADALGLTARTVQRDWVKARVMLQHALEA